MVFGNQPDVKVTFADELNTPDDLKGFLDDAIRIGGQPDLEKALNKATELFEPDYAGERPGVKKFLVVIVDRNTVGDERFVVRYANVLMNAGVKVIMSSSACSDREFKLTLISIILFCSKSLFLKETCFVTYFLLDLKCA